MLTINNTLDGYLKDVEIKGNTVQSASNLADIRSVGDKVEGQELYEIPVLSCGKNLFDINGNYDFISWDNSIVCKPTVIGNTLLLGNTRIDSQGYKIKVKPNTNYVSYVKSSNGEFRHSITDLSGNKLSSGDDYSNSSYISNKSFNSGNNEYILFILSKHVNNDIVLTNIQLEEGTQATPYEPYVEDKITILSPVQLERVGDVRDRIICKDGIWGVEKNVETVVLNGSENWDRYTIGAHEITTRFGVTVDGSKNGQGISDLFKYKYNDDDDEHFKIGNIASKLFVYVNKSRLAENSVFGFKTWLSSNNLTLKYLTNNPTFIPLPHSQQIKLRTFANKTNISFGCEIEGTIKAQVPKSLGATVNTHTEQIGNLNKELDRVKKLEESTVSTVETESDFTTVEATSNGYFEDVKLEGKTLVVNSDNKVVESGIDGAMLKSVGEDADEIVVSSNNNQPKQIETTDDNSITTTIDNPNYQSDKKRLLYYNNETQSWEKPVLRQWDSIEKHSDGKYYYHQRSGEVVLNGSESWVKYGENDNTIRFATETNAKIYSEGMCNTIPYVVGDSSDTEHCRVDGSSKFVVWINKTKLSTQDIAGFKEWLQANNVTVVYQLAQEKVYECTNIDLITYSGETNYLVESGVLSPKTTLKVHNNISNVVSLLQKKVSLLEDTVTDYMITQNRLMLASRYNADTVSFKVDVASLRNSFEYDNDLYNLILNNILVGKDNYNREYIENLIIFYWMDFVISDEMYLTLFEIIEEQHNPKVIEAPIE